MSVRAARLRRPPDRYAFCEKDAFWFRPLYTGGRCPLCGDATDEAAPLLPFAVRLDRFWLGMTALAAVSVGMTVLVLYTYLSG